MEQKQQQTLWKDEEFQVPRLPKTHASEKSESGEGASTGLADIVVNSKLSADAREFVPKSFIGTQPPATSNDSVNDISNQMANVAVNDSTSVELLNDFKANVQKQLDSTLLVLTTQPGQFDEVLPKLLDQLSRYFQDQKTMDHVLSSILQMVFDQNNFGYTAARLCEALGNASDVFMGLLMTYSLMFPFEETCEPARNYGMFVGELFMKFKDAPVGFSNELFRVINELLKFNEAADVKCICQLLKLTGKHLDDLDKNQLNVIISRLQNKLAGLPQSCSYILDSVINLRNSNWGRDQASDRNTQQQYNNFNNENLVQPNQAARNHAWQHTDNVPAYGSAIPNGHNHGDYSTTGHGQQAWNEQPVLYGPDGVELTEEESEFLNNAVDGRDDSDNDNFDPQWNEEMQSAFDQFIAKK